MKKLVLAVALLVVLGLALRLALQRSEPVAAEPLVERARGPDPAPSLVAPGQSQREALVADSPRAAASQPRGALRILVRWDDGTPAPDIGLFVFPEDDPLGERHVALARTDGEGVALVESLHAGRARIEADRGAVLETSVAAGGETEAVLDLPAGIDVEGTVSDASGAPVVDAEILLISGERSWLKTRVVGRSGTNGAYRVRAAGADFAVSARTAHYVPAFLHPLSDENRWGEEYEHRVSVGLAVPPERSVHADLVLDWVDFALRGVVRDPDGRPIAGALLTAGWNRARGYSLHGEPMRQRFGMPVVRTDESGRFEVRGVEHTGMPVAVMAEGFPIQVASFPSWSGSVTYGEIVLEAPAAIEGVVRDPEGAPVGGALVKVQAIRERQARDVPFPLPRTRSDELGRYRLELVAPGRVPVRVEPPAGSALGHGFATVTAASGEKTSLDLRLLDDDVIRGRARDALGAPLAGAEVRCRAEGGSERTTTDAEGRFAFDGCGAPPYRLQLIEPGGYQALAELEGAAPGASELELVAPETGTVTGIFVDEGGHVPLPQDAPETPETLLQHRVQVRTGPAGKPSVTLANLTGARGNIRWDGESFTFESVPVGRYRLVLRAGADPREPSWRHSSDWFEVRSGETVDLGVFRSPRKDEDPAGWLVLEVSPPATTGLSAVLRSEDHDVIGFLEEEGEVRRSGRHAAGHYFACVRAGGAGDVCVPVEIRAREEARIRVRLEPGVARTLSFPTADPGASWNTLKVTVRGGDGQLVLVERLRVQFDDSHSVLVHVPAGRFAVETETDTGLSARGTFTVLAGTEQDAPLVFELR